MSASHNNVTTLLPPTQLILNGATFLLTCIDVLWPLVLEFREKQRPFLRALKAFLLVTFHPLLLHSQDPAFVEMHHKVVGSLALLLTVTLKYNGLLVCSLLGSGFHHGAPSCCFLEWF